MFHYTAGGASATAENIARYQIGPGAQEEFPAIAYHMHVDGSGLTAWCHDFNRRVWGSGGAGWNERGIHVCYSGDVAPNEAQIKGLRTAYQFAVKQMGRPLQGVPHNATTSTSCPGPKWADWGPKVISGFEPGPAVDTAPSSAYSMEPDHQFSLAELWPLIQEVSNEYGSDPRMLAGMVQQESTFHNYRVHRDGTGHGLLGYDDGGLLPDFEQWSGLSVGRGPTAAIIPVEPQLEFAARQLRKFQDYYGEDEYVGARAWHAGGSGRNSDRGKSYETLIRQRIQELGL